MNWYKKILFTRFTRLAQFAFPNENQGESEGEFSFPDHKVPNVLRGGVINYTDIGHSDERGVYLWTYSKENGLKTVKYNPKNKTHQREFGHGFTISIYGVDWSGRYDSKTKVCSISPIGHGFINEIPKDMLLWLKFEFGEDTKFYYFE